MRWVHEHWGGLLIAVLGWALRAFRRAPEFVSSDAADLAVKIQDSVCGGKGFLHPFTHLMLHRLGGVQRSLIYVETWVANAFDASLGGPELERSTLLVSAFAIFFAYRFANELGGKPAGWSLAALLAVSPIHVMTGRHLGAPWAYEVCFQMAILWLAVRHFRAPERARGIALCALIAVYLWCGNQVAGLLPALAFALCVARVNASSERLWDFSKARIGGGFALVPLISLATLLYFTFVREQGHLAHALSKRNAFGWYFGNWCSDLVKDLGYVPAWLTLLCVPIALFATRRVFAWERLPFVYLLGYALPFWVFVRPQATLTEGYAVYGFTGLLAVTALAPFQIGLPTRWAMLFHGALCASLLAGLGASAYRLYPGKALGVAPFQGAYVPSRGLEAAAAFVHEQDPEGRAGAVFSDRWLEPSQMRFYFRRRVFSLYDAPANKPFKAYSKRADEIGFLVVKPGSAKLVRKYFPEFSKHASVVDRARRGKAVLLVYSRKPKKYVKLDLATAHDRYRAAYPGLCSNRLEQ